LAVANYKEQLNPQFKMKAHRIDTSNTLKNGRTLHDASSAGVLYDVRTESLM
jgi:hypothetical protein